MLGFLISEINTGNADYYAENIGKTIDEIGPEKVIGLIIDDASVCRKNRLDLMDYNSENGIWGKGYVKFM